MTSQRAKQFQYTYSTHYLKKCKQWENEIQLIEYNKKKFFLKNHTLKYGWETIPILFSKKTKLTISLDQ